jgi:hypothetical protein
VLSASAAAVISVIVLAILDIYLTGHSYASMGRPWVDWAIFDLSRADVIFLGVTLLGLIVGLRLGPVRRPA